MNRLSICIAEDSKVVRGAIQSLLISSGYFDVAGTAANGREAIALCREARPQVVLLDVSMPEMSGIEAARQIAAVSPDTVIIVLSSHDDMEVIRQALKAGARDFIRKPVHGPELIQKILTIYNREGSRRSSSADTGRRKILGFMGPKAGVGCTTLACNSAVVLARKMNKKVLAVDLDPLYGDLTHCINSGGRRDQSVLDLLRHERPEDGRVLDQFVTRTAGGVHLLAAPPQPTPDLLANETLVTVIRAAESAYDFIVLDLPATLTPEWVRLVSLSDLLVLVLSNDMPCIRCAKVCLEVLKKSNYPARKVKVVFNHVTPSGGVDRRDLQDFINFPIFEELTHDRETTTKAYLARTPFAAKGENQIAKDVDRFVDRLVTAYEGY